MKRILVLLVLSLACLVGVSAPATAAPPNRDVQYTYYNVQLTDADGTTGVYTMVALVKYSRDGTVYTQCSYGQRNPETHIMEPRGFYRVDYAVADTSSEGLRQFCVDNFPNRTRI